MSIHEQQNLKEKYYGEAIRYMDNANDCLAMANKEGKFYNDPKYVRMACGTAYNGVLMALDCYLMLKGVEKPNKKKRKSIEYYQVHISKLDGKMTNSLNNAYQILHLSGYYDGVTDSRVVDAGFDHAYTIIEKIKPAQAGL